MNKSKALKYTLIVGGMVALLGVTYLGGVGYYADRFLANTELLGVDVGGLTLEEGQKQVHTTLNAEEVQLYDKNRHTTNVTLEELGVSINSEGYVESVFNNQSPTQWLTQLITPSQYDITHSTLVGVGEAGVVSALEQKGITNSERSQSVDASIGYNTELGYHVVEEQQGNQLDTKVLTQLIKDSLDAKPKAVELSEAYIQPERTKDDELIKELMDEINATLNTTIKLNFGDVDETISTQQIEDWIYFDSQNNLKIDRDLVYAYLGELNERYATYDMYRNFNSTNWGEISIAPGTLGWSIDREREADYIVSQLELAQDSHEQPYVNGTGFGSSNIGPDYVEVDLTKQHMYVYLNNILALETPIVSGQVGTDTVPGAYAVWNKESPSNLVGYNPRTQSDYVQPVTYWIAFDDTGQGIHDANWQSSFGGTTYQVSGSLGCINTPPGVMPQVYQLVYNGMPVIVH